MRIHHKPGDAMEVGWAGGTLSIKDPVTGETVPAYLFVGVLPCSCYVYAELCSDMKSENWLLCHVRAYEYFGGVPGLTIPDNLRTGVLKNTRMETVLNRSYSELACFLASNFFHFHRYDSLKSALYIHAVSKNINTFPKNQGRIRAAIAVEILDFTVMYR